MRLLAIVWFTGAFSFVLGWISHSQVTRRSALSFRERPGQISLAELEPQRASRSSGGTAPSLLND